MRWITFLFLWIVAVVLALVILRRVRRGKPVVLTGRWSPRLVRMIVVVLVVVGIGEESRPLAAEPTKASSLSEEDKLPATIQPQTIQTWLGEHQEGSRFSVGKQNLARALAGGKLDASALEAARKHAGTLVESLRKIVLADLDARVSGKPAPAVEDKQLLTALSDMETSGRFDHFWNAYLWRQANAEATDAKARIELYARIRQHARITDSLIRANAQVKPLMLSQRAWMSKAGPPAGFGKAQLTTLADMVKVANELLPTTDEGTWKRDGALLLKPTAVPPILIHGGKEKALPLNVSNRFGRLDLLKTGDKVSTVQFDWLGDVELPANKLISVWELPALLPKEAKQTLDETVHEALKNNSEEAADRLERYLPVSHQAIRVGLKELPTSKGAPRLRLILAMFDEVVMPALTGAKQVGDLGIEFRGGR